MLKGTTKQDRLKAGFFLIKSNSFNKIKYTLIRSILEEIG